MKSLKQWELKFNPRMKLSHNINKNYTQHLWITVKVASFFHFLCSTLAYFNKISQGAAQKVQLNMITTCFINWRLSSGQIVL